MKNSIKLLYVDLFCGAGGTSTGVERATVDGQKCAHVIACVNHDPHAIASHLANHPEAVHFTEDIRILDLTGLSALTKQKRKEFPEARLVLWASLECTNFSKAKGGMPRDADSRTLAEHLFRYIEALNPDYIQIENVEEFMSWGDIDDNGKPISKDKGRKYLLWTEKVKKYGYDFACRILNAADYGAYTSRRRYFGIFAKHGLNISFPEPTHQRRPQKGLYGQLKPWMSVKEVLDLDDYGQSIFRKKKLAEKTLERIYAGLVKFVANGKMPSGDKQQWLSKQFSGDPASKNIALDNPAGTITCKDHHAIITASYGDGTPNPNESFPSNIIQFLDQQYGRGKPASIDKPAGTITTKPKFNLVSVKKEHFLVNPQFSSKGASIEEPCFTLIARMDKKPPYLATVLYEGSMIPCEDDSPMEKKIKQFMNAYNIRDIYMRMLNEKELLRIQGFGDGYTLIGTGTERKKYIGNAVEVNMARSLCEDLCRAL